MKTTKVNIIVEVENLGCICFDLEADSCDATLRRTGTGTGTLSELKVVAHDPRCPFAVAEYLRRVL